MTKAKDGRPCTGELCMPLNPISTLAKGSAEIPVSVVRDREQL